MDQSTEADWLIIREETHRNQPRIAERVLASLRSLEEIQDGFAVDQLVHSLQTAARAEKDGASDELILAALCHDLGKAISVWGHAAISAAILKPYVSQDTVWLVEKHQLFEARHYARHFQQDPDQWKSLQGHPMFATTWRFVEEWDQTAFDPDYPTPALEHFEPLVRTWLARPLSRK